MILLSREDFDDSRPGLCDAVPDPDDIIFGMTRPFRSGNYYLFLPAHTLTGPVAGRGC